MTSEQNQNQTSGNEFEVSAGFEREEIESEAVQQQPRPEKKSKSDEMKRNLSAVFGHGVGKLSIIVVVVVALSSLALGVRGLNQKQESVRLQSDIDVPNAPQPGIDMGEVSKQEFERRAQQAAREAAVAAERGETYQPNFDTKIIDNTRITQDGVTQFNVPVGNDYSHPQAGGAVNITIPTGSNLPKTDNSYQNQASTPQNTQIQNQLSQQAAKTEQELKQAQAEREKYVATVKEQVLKQAQSLFGEQGQGGLNAQGAYSSVSYYPQNTSSSGAATGTNTAASQAVIGNPSGKLLIKTGNMMYATLDSEVNTDDGGDVLATIRGGAWDGSKIIGRVEQGPNNIRLKFSILAPQDNRPTMAINAIALREEDAKQGVADDIDNHVFERYASLAAASLLSGYGKAYSQPSGTTIVTNGTVVTTTEDPTTKRVVANAVGEMGDAISQEVRRGFNRPPTYSTPAQKGFGLFFMQDVHEQK